jgi:hypothetical protein
MLKYYGIWMEKFEETTKESKIKIKIGNQKLKIHWINYFWENHELELKRNQAEIIILK